MQATQRPVGAHHWAPELAGPTVLWIVKLADVISGSVPTGPCQLVRPAPLSLRCREDPEQHVVDVSEWLRADVALELVQSRFTQAGYETCCSPLAFT
jgi:hypothetical protein